MKTITEHDTGTTLTLKIGEAFAVRLAENPTTGYKWDVLAAAQPLLDMTHDEYQAAGGNLAGAGGSHLWHFAARSAGTGALTLAYKRAWESKPPVQTFTITVTVS